MTSRQLVLESQIDTTQLWFHGSSEARVQELAAPSFRHPFYVTTDLHYAMAFCTKSQSMTGEYDDRELKFTPASQNFVYVVTLNPAIKVFDFRAQDSAEFRKVFSKIIDLDLFDWAADQDKSLDRCDIYDFCAIVDQSILAVLQKSEFNYLKYSKLYQDEKSQMDARLFLRACSFCKKMGYPQDKLDVLDMHQIMEPILKELQKQGYHAIQTKEVDANEEFIGKHERHEVHTSNALGVFDKHGLDLLGLVPMKYKWLKRVNPAYLEDTTSQTAQQKVKTFVEKYKKFIKKPLAESKLDASRHWYFGNNRSKNLRLTKPSWSHPFFLTTGYKYAEDYSDYGVYKLELKSEVEHLDILDFDDDSEVQKLKWPSVLVQKIRDGESDLNGIAYDLYLLAYGDHGKLMQISWSDEWQAAADYFKDKSQGLLKKIPAGNGTWGDEDDHEFVLQMWKDIHDAGFNGFTHTEFGNKILAIFDIKCIDKISANPLKSSRMLAESKQTYLQKNANEPDVKSIVDKFWIIKSRLHSPENDIDWWIKKPYSDLKSFVLNFDSRNKSQKKQDNYRKEALESGAKLLDTKDGYEIWYVPTYEAMTTLGRFYKGRSAKWCVASDDPEFWYENHDEDEFVLLIREQPKGDEFDKVAIQMENHGRYYNEDDIIPWDLENDDWTFTNDELIHYAWLLFKDNGELRERYY